MKNLKITYILALTIIGIVVALSQFLVQKAISNGDTDAQTIYLSNRQITLSQSLLISAKKINDALNYADVQRSKESLNANLELFKRAQELLRSGTHSEGIFKINNSDKTLSLYNQQKQHYDAIIALCFNVLDVPPEENYLIGQKYYTNLVEARQAYVDLMREISANYVEESSERLSGLSEIEYGIFAVTVALLLFEAFYIFRPAINKIVEYTETLAKKEISLKKSLVKEKKAFELQKAERKKVEYLNRQAKTVFKNVTNGLFLLKEDFSISEMHSASLEKIFGQQDLGGENFIKLMRPKLIYKEQMALDMFAKQLFNPKISEPLIRKVNPLDHVQIFFDDHNASMTNRHLEVSFFRIIEDRRIKEVLVNVADVTQAVKLQAQVDEAEERNRKESAQLLAILRVDPFVLEEYLDNVEEDIQSIIIKYEANKQSRHLEKLLDFTYRIVHNLKGNAFLIDLELLGDKFHQIEDKITELNEMEQRVEGKDFLKIIIDLDEILKMIDNMKNLIDRIKAINNTVQDQAKIDPELAKQRLYKAIKNRAEKIAAQLGKRVDVRIEDDGAEIPEKFRLSLKDILIHLVQNSLVHGLEGPSERKEAGKPEVAQVALQYEFEDDQFHLKYWDDGRGIDTARLGARLVEKGVVSELAYNSLQRSEQLKFIFRQGISTSDDVNNLAGRGQGMNIIQGIIERFDGSYKIHSEVGKGFGIDLYLPALEHEAIPKAG